MPDAFANCWLCSVSESLSAVVLAGYRVDRNGQYKKKDASTRLPEGVTEQPTPAEKKQRVRDLGCACAVLMCVSFHCTIVLPDDSNRHCILWRACAVLTCVSFECADVLPGDSITRYILWRACAVLMFVSFQCANVLPDDSNRRCVTACCRPNALPLEENTVCLSRCSQ